jgi:plasmid stabilization system protein ParE
MAEFGFHPDALLEYAEAASYYTREASPQIAESFIAAVDAAIRAIVAAPTRWRVVDEPDVRRYVFRRFPYVLYYRWEEDREVVAIYALMNCSREPGYWKERLPDA